MVTFFFSFFFNSNDKEEVYDLYVRDNLHTQNQHLIRQEKHTPCDAATAGRLHNEGYSN